MTALDIDGCRKLPGLINAHDHLEFSLFPRLGRGRYRNATEWARDIYKPHESPVAEHLRVPKRLRLLWGGLRNLLSGVTTVCHHNPYEPLFDRGFPVRVVKRFGWAHSLHFSPDLSSRYRDTPRTWPFIVHAAEGVDAVASREIFDLAHVLSRRTILVHAVGLDAEGWDLVRKSGASVIWCPSSNTFMFGRTIRPPSGIPIALGTDSPLTSCGDLLDEITHTGLPMSAVYPMISENAARILRIKANQDWIAVRELGAPPEVVVVGGQVRLIAPRLAEQLSKAERRGLYPIQCEGRPPVLVRMNLPKLKEQTARILGDEIRLGGRRVKP